ncbi:MAG: hypothetical protein KF757_07810 [Phycisphaeraceae bacterium]|nr:hypothetical protein [Phycisphaeraceae bacterium]MCW5762659.1 hypothetical protein [Phycisphaeraceae bacterium]
MADRKQENSIDEAALDETVVDVTLEESLDQVDTAPKQSTAVSPDEVEFDPEAHTFNVRNKQSIKKVVASDGGQLVLALVAALVGIAVGIYATFIRTTPWLIAAGVVTPATLIYAFARWRLWLGQAPYLYRLLTSLGEDADDLLEGHRQKLVQKGKLPSDPTDEH